MAPPVAELSALMRTPARLRVALTKRFFALGAPIFAQNAFSYCVPLLSVVLIGRRAHNAAGLEDLAAMGLGNMFCRVTG